MARGGKEHQLKDGRSYTVREARLRDAGRIVQYHRKILAEPDRFVTDPDEYRTSPLQQAAEIRRCRRAPNCLFLVADAGKRVIGTLDFRGGQRRKQRHAGTFAISVDRDFRRQGVGTALFGALADWARQTAALEKLSLAVFAENESAIAFYRRLGFREEGRRRREYKTKDGRYLDDLLFCLFLDGEGGEPAGP